MANVTVCVKRVPHTETRIKVGADGKSVDESGVKYILNPYDEIALAEGVRIAKETGGEVTVVTLGPPDVAKDVRTCLAMGAARAVHLVHEAPFRDALAVTRTLVDAIRETSPDLVLVGRQAIDNDNALVGPMLATLLGWPAVPDVTKVEIDGSKLRAEREIEGGATECYELELPCVLTAQKGLIEPSYPKLKEIMAAKKKPLDAKDVEPAASSLQAASLALPPPRSEGRIVGEGADAVPELLRLLREEAKAL